MRVCDFSYNECLFNGPHVKFTNYCDKYILIGRFAFFVLYDTIYCRYIPF